MIPAQSTIQRPSTGIRFHCALFLFLLHLLPAPVSLTAARAGTLEIDTARVISADWRIEDASLVWNTADNRLSLTADTLHTGSGQEEFSVTDISLVCERFIPGSITRCSDGELALQPGIAFLRPNMLTARFGARLDVQTTALEADGHLALGALSGPFSMVNQPESGLGLQFDPDPLELDTMAGLLVDAPEMMSWITAGSADLQVGLNPDPDVSVQLSGLAFDSPDGRFAAEGLELLLEYQPGSPGAHLQGQFEDGQLLLDSLYVDFNERQPRFELQLPESFNAQQGFRLTGRWLDGNTFQADFGLALTDEQELAGFSLENISLDLEDAYAAYLDGPARAAGFGLESAAGRVSGSLRYESGSGLQSDLDIENASLVDARDRYTVTGLSGGLHWNQTEAARLSWSGASLFNVPLGPARMQYQAEDDRFTLLESLVMPVLGGDVAFSRLAIGLGAGDAEQLVLEAHLEGLSLQRLSRILGWPELQGSLGGDIPRVSIQDGIVQMDGALQLDVFDGEALVEGLRVERLFSVAPALAASIRFSNLDLEQVTGAFSFGQITGRLDGVMADLRLLNWTPVAFDAHFSSPQQKTQERRISQRAVDNIASIGGGAAAVSSTFLRIFDDFGYRRLGIGCRLHNQVCHLSGLTTTDDNGLLLVEGAGIPRINVIAFNQRVNWPLLLAQLKAATEGAGPRLGDSS